MRQFVGVLAALVALSHHAVTALFIDVTPVQRLLSPPSPHEVLEQRWTIEKSTPNDGIEALHFDAFSQVVVSYVDSPPATSSTLAASVRVAGSDFKIINAVDVKLLSTRNGVEILLKNNSRVDGLDGYIGIELVLHQRSRVHSIHHAGSGDIILHENVLVNNDPTATISLVHAGTGDLFVPHDSHFNVSRFSITGSDDGSVYFPSSSGISAKLVAFALSGTGSISANLSLLSATKNITITAAGNGNVCIDGEHLETFVTAVDHAGGGDVYIGHAGSSVAGLFHVEGTGNVDMGSIQCIDVDVELFGSGNVTVQSARSLSGHAFGPGLIMFAGEMPVDILPVDPWAYITVPIAHEAPSYSRRTCSIPATPARAISRITFIKASATSMRRLSFVIAFIIGFGAMYLLDKRRQRRSRDGEDTPLLRGNETTPVYV